MFRFLWISACPTYSALPVNAKEVSGDVHFRRKLLFHCCSMILESQCSCTCSHFTGSKLCLLSIFTHSCIYLAFRYLLIKFAWDGSSHFMMSMHTFCDSLNKSLGWIILLISRTVVWSFGCCLNSFGHVSRCGVLDNIYLCHLVLIWPVCPWMLGFTGETLSKFTRIFIFSVI